MSSRSFLGEALLLIFCLSTLGVFEPNFNAVNFRDMTLQLAIDDGSANLANQLKWLALAGVATLTVSRHLGRLRTLIIAAWPLVLVFAYCLLSSAWSDYPEISIRRSFGLIIPAYCLFAAIAIIDRPERVANVVYIAFWAALIGNLLALPLPSAFDEVGFYRGITSNKNILGSIGALAILVGLAISPLRQGTQSRLLLLLYFGGWSYLLVLSVSKTSIALALLVPFLFYFLSAISMCFRIGIGSMATLLGTGLLIIVGACYAILGETLTDIVHIAWSDATFTGRTYLWNFMLGSISKNWITGIGFGSFWSVGDHSPNFYAALDYIRLLNQAHNGYLDLLAALGVIGTILVIAMMAQPLGKVERLRYTVPWLFRFIWFIAIFSLIHNMMESSLLVPFSIVWHLTLLAYVLAIWNPHPATMTAERLWLGSSQSAC